MAQKAKILLRGLDSQKRHFFYMFFTTENIFFIKFWNLEFSGSNLSNFGQKLDQIQAKMGNMIFTGGDSQTMQLFHISSLKHRVWIFHKNLKFGPYRFKINLFGSQMVKLGSKLNVVDTWVESLVFDIWVKIWSNFWQKLDNFDCEKSDFKVCSKFVLRAWKGVEKWSCLAL